VVHVALLGAGVYLSLHGTKALKKPASVLLFKLPPPLPPPAPPPPAGQNLQSVNVRKNPPPIKAADTIIDPKEPPTEGPKNPAAEPQGTGTEAATCGGVGQPSCGAACGGPGQAACGPACGGIGQAACGAACGGIGQAACAPPCGGPGQPCGAGGETVLHFNDTMVRPTLLAGEERPQPSREALMAKVEGLVVASCTITSGGSVTNCRLIKSLPYMDDAVLSNLQARKYTPVMFQGRPVSVEYKFSFRIVQPQ